MSKRAALLSLVLVFGCSGEDPPIEIAAFTSSASAVARGRPVTLAWSVRNADTITLIREPDTTLLDGHGVLEGSQVTEPIDRSTAFTLIAKRADVTDSRTIRVTALGTNEMVAITNFTAEPTSVRRGQTVTLQWNVAGASGASITDRDGNTIAAEAELPSGSLEIMPNSSTTYVFEALGPGGPARAEVTVTVREPTIEVFASSPAAITVGESADLTYAVSQASSVTITDQNDNVVLDTTELFGTVTVMPVATTTYLLTATDEGGVEATAMITLDVTEPVQAEILDFTATPNATDIGEPSVLAWSVQNAPGGIAIEAGGNVLVRSADRMGTFSVVQAVSTTYTLTAFSSGGNATRSVAIASNPSPPAVFSFEATPPSAVLGTSTVLSWSALGATNVEIFRGNVATGTLEYTATTDLVAGAVTVPINDASTTFTLRAQNGNGDRAMTVTVDAFPAPSIIGFNATPLTFSSTPTQVNLGWSTSDAQSVELFVGGVRDTSFPGTTIGNHMVSVSQTTLFEIVASNPAAAVSRTLLVSETVGETEPNDTAATAFMGLINGGNTPGSIATAEDVDWFQITVPAGGGVRAETSDGMGGCVIDTVLQLWRDDGNGMYSMLGEDDEGGTNGCSLIDRTTDAYAADLLAGTYFVRVSSKSGPGNYTVSIGITAASCPNGIQETNNPAGAEQCDDNNTIDTDSCTNMCQRNLTTAGIGTRNGTNPYPAVVSSFNGSLALGEERFVTLDLSGATNGAYLMARTWAAASPMCNADTVLTLYDDLFQVIGTNDQSGVDDCSLIHPGIDGQLQPFADLAAGVYYLGVSEFGNDAPIASFSVEVRAETRNRCGNQVTEATEECDDGNTVTTDSCDACTFNGLVEVEPNDAVASANDAGSQPWIRGHIDAAADEDWYEVSVTNNHSLVVTTTDGLGGCALETGGVPVSLTLYEELPSNPGVVTMLGSVSQNLDGGCAEIDGRQQTFAQSLPAGRNYYVAVAADDGTSTGLYQVSVSTIAPGCGNQIVEAGEQCDDGNMTMGDGCDSCAFEIASTVTATGTGSSTDMVTIPVDGFAVVRVQTAAGTDIQVATADAGGMTCNIDTAIAIVDANGALVGSEETGTLAPGTCAEIDPAVSTFAANLTAGTYYVVVFNQNLMQITGQVVTTTLP